MAAGQVEPSKTVKLTMPKPLAGLTKWIDPPKFDLDSYIANYRGKTRFYRLCLIGQCSAYLQLEALKAAVAEAKKGKNVDDYDYAVNALRDASPDDPDAIIDTTWRLKTMKHVNAETERLENELKGYKNNLIKESIRMGHEDLGAWYHQTGNLLLATKAYARMRDYCTTPAHMNFMQLRVIEVSIDRGDWMAVQSNVTKIRNLSEGSNKLEPKLSTAMGLSHLAGSSYKEAAKDFLNTPTSLGDSFNNFITPNDVAVYGGLCALATMNRTELQEKVLDNASFRNFLELEPHIRRAISFFVKCRYTQCLELLNAYKNDYHLDLHLQRHITKIYGEIRDKSIVEYFVPFSSIRLESMASSFPGDRPIKDEMVEMIQNGLLDARIDSPANLLIKHKVDPRMMAYEGTIAKAEGYKQALRMRLLHMNMVEAGLVVQPPKKGGPGGQEALGRGAGVGDVMIAGQGGHGMSRTWRDAEHI
ncbi:MAG: hypothetical protein M1834_004597 [Cirrosporium novae-zelandiae]|nr:MAG: hypothetical protein M1834_004597 [Cirrosporium novae-zelandiae]